MGEYAGIIDFIVSNVWEALVVFGLVGGSGYKIIKVRNVFTVS